MGLGLVGWLRGATRVTAGAIAMGSLSTALSAQPAYLVKDINPSTPWSDPTDLTAIGTTVYFVANDGIHGRELWKSDGTAASTVLVRDIAQGPGYSLPGELTNVNGTLLFEADDGVNGAELWRSDGTEAGTVLVKDILPGPLASHPQILTEVKGVLFFQAFSYANGWELWKSDGTAAGTVLVKSVFATGMTNVNGTLFFSGHDDATGWELWKSDGTSAGTVLVKDVNPGSTDSSPNDLTNVRGTLFFRAIDAAHGYELWRSDGTAAGTVLVEDIVAGSAGSFPENLTLAGGTLFFIAHDETSGGELWKSDGTEAGTTLVKDIAPGPADSFLGSLKGVNGTLFFQATDGTSGLELWKSDGTDSGTTLVKDINPDGGGYPDDLADVYGTLFFAANDGVSGGELWKSDGMPGGTEQVQDIWPGIDGAIPGALTISGSRLFFAAHDGSTGRELWSLDLDLVLRVLTVSRSGSGSGTVTSSPPGIDCGTDCTESYTYGTLVTLTPTAADGSTFSGWSGACAGKGACVVTVDGVKSVGARFTRDDHGRTDFNGDGTGDILWRHQVTGALYVWLMDGPAQTAGSYLTPNAVADIGWQIRGVADFDGDGKVDILWHHQLTGALYVWLMDGTAQTAGGYLTPNAVADTGWQIRGVADFDGDGKVDILWHHQVTGALYVWHMDGTAQTDGSYLTPNAVADTDWQVRGVADFDGDGKVDILWHHQVTGALYVWFMDGTVEMAGSYLTPNAVADTRWQICGVADLDADDKVDLLWRHQATGDLYAWFLDGTATVAGGYLTPASVADTLWQPVPR